ncbi:L-arabinose isomerase domain protein [[Clostridium] sordellii ATCC 9714]|nr:L-arabinose isomerase domain protein [[Clostridium] sordellii ATCC 9714] [Paeniclostridium sordellii ATCC 9714]
MFNINSFWEGFISLARNISIADVVDIAIVTYIFYKIYTFIKDTRAEQVLKGMLFLLVATKVSEIFNLHTLYWMLENTLTVGLIAVLIIFQPELRSGLEYIGKPSFHF